MSLVRLYGFKSFGDRAFANEAPTLDYATCIITDTFQERLKTHLYIHAFIGFI